MKCVLMVALSMVVSTLMFGGTAFARMVDETNGGQGGDGTATINRCGGGFLGFRPWYAGLTDGSCNVRNPASEADISPFVWKIITNILFDLLVVAGYLAVGFIIFGGYTYLLARGDTGKVEKGKKTIIAAVSGLVIVVVASFIVSFISGNIIYGGV